MSRIFAVAFATILFAASSASAATHDRCVTGATIYSATEAPRAATVCITAGRISGIFDAAAAAPDARCAGAPSLAVEPLRFGQRAGTPAGVSH